MLGVKIQELLVEETQENPFKIKKILERVHLPNQLIQVNYNDRAPSHALRSSDVHLDRSLVPLPNRRFNTFFQT